HSVPQGPQVVHQEVEVVAAGLDGGDHRPGDGAAPGDGAGVRPDVEHMVARLEVLRQAVLVERDRVLPDGAVHGAGAGDGVLGDGVDAHALTSLLSRSAWLKRSRVSQRSCLPCDRTHCSPWRTAPQQKATAAYWSAGRSCTSAERIGCATPRRGAKGGAASK